jgi:hypothetical protein
MTLRQVEGLNARLREAIEQLRVASTNISASTTQMTP